jgi:hypothetical protein
MIWMGCAVMRLLQWGWHCQVKRHKEGEVQPKRTNRKLTPVFSCFFTWLGVHRFFLKENLPRFMVGEDLLNPVDPELGY